MRFKLGRIGPAESACALGITLCVNGIVCIDQKYAYTSGNSTYISIPLSLAFSFLMFLALCALMRKRGADDLWELLNDSLGRVFGIAAALMLCASLLIGACVPLGRFTHVLDDMVYDGVEFPTLLAFLVPAVCLLALKGLETIGRTAKCFAWLLLAAAGLAFVLSLSGQQSYRMYPIAGDGIGHLAGVCASSGAGFLPPFAATLVFGGALQGTRHAERSALRAAAVSAAVCFLIHLMLARLYTYKGLSSIMMPLCRIGYLGIERSYVMWLDKLLVMTWLNGCIISSGYCVYSAALLYARAFGQNDVTPAVFLMTLVSCAAVLSEFALGIEAADALNGFALRWGVLLSFVPLAACAAAALLRTEKKGRTVFE